jgi:hypothetical protein
LVAITFVHEFSDPMPTTDEWFFTNSIVGMQAFDLHTIDGIEGAIHAWPRRYGDHWVVVPFLFYWPLAEWTDLDSRAFMYMTLAVFVIEALLLWRYVFDRSAWAFPVALLLLSPSHYMEFLWGWQHTLAFSIVLPLAGLIVVHRMSKEPSLVKQGLLLALGLLLCLLGTLSSSGGFFGFVCVPLLLLLVPMRARPKSAWIVVAIAATACAYATLMRGSTDKLALGSQQIWQVFTALGGTIFGTQAGIFRFELEGYSATGLVIAACTAFVVFRAIRLHVIGELALALAICVFGLLCTAAIAMARGILGNWHLQYTLLAVCGAYAAAYRLWKLDRTAYSAAPFCVLLLTTSACVAGWWNGFTLYAPRYQAYVQMINGYCRTYLAHPERRRPFPPTVDVNPRMMLFLSAHHHPFFRDKPASKPGMPLPDGARVFLNTDEIGAQGTITVAHKLSLLTVVFPGGTDARGVTARIGREDVVLRRVHAIHCAVSCSAQPGAVSFVAMIVPRVVGRGVYPIELSIHR